MLRGHLGDARSRIPCVDRIWGAPIAWVSSLSSPQTQWIWFSQALEATAPCLAVISLPYTPPFVSSLGLPAIVEPLRSSKCVGAFEAWIGLSYLADMVQSFVCLETLQVLGGALHSATFPFHGSKMLRQCPTYASVLPGSYGDLGIRLLLQEVPWDSNCPPC